MPIVPLASYAQGTSPFVEYRPTIGLQKHVDAGFQLTAGNLWKIDDGLSLGYGLGLWSTFKFSSPPAVPVFMRTVMDFSHGRIIPFASLDLGVGLSPDDMENTFALISPSIGAKVGKYYISMGYQADIPFKKGFDTAHNVTFSMGRFINDDFFISRSYFKTEVGYAIGLSEKECVEDYDRYKATGLGTEAFARLTFMMQIGKQFEMGIGSGVDVFLPSYEYGRDDKSGQQLLSIPVYVRPQYNIFDKEAPIQPYVACDLGLRIADNKGDGFKGFLLEPQVGLKFDNWEVAIALHTATYYADNNGDQGGSSRVSGLAFCIGHSF